MAGAGYKLFNTGDVLTAAQVNTYLQEQVVMVFASAAARTTALSGVLAEGMVSYLKDTDALEIYSGSAWVGYGSGDITGVTAGTGISGGGTSGTVTITNSMATEITAAGDIIVGTGSGTFDNLPIGTTGQVLTADTSVSPYKVKWATASSSSGALTKITNNTFTTASTVVMDDIFSSTYDKYLLLLNISAASATDPDVLVYFRSSGGTDVTTNNVSERIISYSTSLTSSETTTARIGATSTGYPSFSQIAMIIHSPNLAQNTVYTTDSLYVTNGGAPYQSRIAGYNFSNTQMTGIKIYPSSGTITGKVTVYGYTI